MRRIILQLFPQPFNINRQRIVVHKFSRTVPDLIQDLPPGKDLPPVIQKNQKQPVFHGREKHFLISAIDLSDPEIHLIFPHGHKLGSLFFRPGSPP